MPTNPSAEHNGGRPRREWHLSCHRRLPAPPGAALRVAISALVAGVLELGSSFGAGEDIWFAITLLLALGLIALHYRLSLPKPESPRSGSR